ncbi:erythromycin esterase family protein [Phenylobacterium sp.]|uniref:erythromycin esterase family protein n=1 Tax=Phenylobacterium sp. TaxID=1871053 RepID=UPI002E30486F|nr:erythromycin esterase family protein [Phenylobacterium sp.]HEX2559042.1 erythromycin esterase family protein [Phenylobacterium sp.]
MAAALALAGASPLATPVVASPVVASEPDEILLQRAGEADFILLGENTHGTREYYHERARITLELVRAGEVRAVAIEGDYAGGERVNRYVRGLGGDRTARQALSSFDEFPAWMWRNQEFETFVEALRTINLERPPEDRVGVYGIDVYDLAGAADAVVAYLKARDARAAAQVERAYSTLTRHGREMSGYARAVARGGSQQTEAQAGVRALAALPPLQGEDAEARFAAERAAATVVAGEEYFRVQVETGYSWNARDRRMAAAAIAVHRHVNRTGPDAGVVIWAHNTHVGDARETSMQERGEVSLGQLLREQGRAYLVGFFTDGGQVMAAEEWGEAPRVHRVRKSLPGSHEYELARGADRQVVLHDPAPASTAKRRLQRAIGVVYLPHQEREAHYIEATPERQFDAVIFVRHTNPVRPHARATAAVRAN